MPNCFGGASDAQTSLANTETSFANTLEQNYLTQHAQQQASLGDLSQILQNVQNGKLLPGFDASTLASLNTSAIDTTAANYRNAAQTTQNAFAGKGGDSGLETGIQAQVGAATASAAAGQLSAEQQKIQLANRQAQEQNTATAIGGYNALAGQQNPLGYANAAGGELNSAFGAQSEINQLQNQQMANELNFGTSVALDAATFGAGAGGGGGLTGGFKALSTGGGSLMA